VTVGGKKEKIGRRKLTPGGEKGAGGACRGRGPKGKGGGGESEAAPVGAKDEVPIGKALLKKRI